MGNDISKEINDIAEILEEDGKSFMTPTNKTRFIQMDPRSPTEGIVRTPIEVRKDCEFSDERCTLRRRWKSEPDITPGKRDKLEKPFYILGDDPRSPTLGITRTPIQVFHDEERVCANVYCSNESLGDTILEQNAVLNVNVVPDCRSPSLGICRTPIQIAASHGDKITRDLPIAPPVSLSKESNMNVTPIMTWQTPVSKRISSPFVFADVDGVEIKGKKEIKQYEQNSIHEKENDASLKRKLVFTPEPMKTGVKVRTPLGSRCNFQDSPSQLLKVMQVHKVGQELANGVENACGNSLPVKSIKKTNPVVDWDNKDSTIIM